MSVLVVLVSTPLVRLIPFVIEFHELDSSHGTSMRNIRIGVFASVASTVYSLKIAVLIVELKGT